MGDEQDKLEDEMEQMHHQNERKLQMIKGKLYLLLSALSLGKELRIDRDKATIEVLFKELQDLAHQIPKQLAMAQVQGGASSRQQLTERNMADPLESDRRSTNQNTLNQIDHSRLPPEVQAAISRTPRTHYSTAVQGNEAYDNMRGGGGNTALRSPKNARVRSKSREAAMNELIDASAALTNEVATDFVDRGRFN